MSFLGNMVAANAKLDQAFGVLATLGAASIPEIDKRTGLPVGSKTITPTTITVRLGRRKITSSEGAETYVDTAQSAHQLKVGDTLTINGFDFTIVAARPKTVQGNVIGWIADLQGGPAA